MKALNDIYQNIIKNCKFIAKEDVWFIEGTECKNVDKCNYSKYTKDSLFNEGFSLFNGITNNSYKGYSGELPRKDSESCCFTEFYIYDEFNNEISELTLDQYKQLLRTKKLIEILK